MTQRIFFPLLPGLNEMIAAAKVRRGGWSSYASLKSVHGLALLVLIREAKLKPMARVTMAFTWCEKNKCRDPDNVAAGGRKLILDALVNAKVLADDGWDEIESWRDLFTVSPNKPGVWVEMTEA